MTRMLGLLLGVGRRRGRLEDRSVAPPKSTFRSPSAGGPELPHYQWRHDSQGGPMPSANAEFESRTNELLADAAQYLPGGSTWQWSLPPDLTFIADRGEGSTLYDTRGRAFIDYVLGSGPLLLGHAHPAIVQAVQAQIGKGSTFHCMSEPTVRLAKRIC